MTKVEPVKAWADAKTHRDPNWPVGGFAPGGYLGGCQRCGREFMGMDKYAYECFPCAVENLVETARLAKSDLREANSKIKTLTDSISIVQTPITPEGE